MPEIHFGNTVKPQILPIMPDIPSLPQEIVSEPHVLEKL